MNRIGFYLIALTSGLLFGTGMAVSGMISPEKVIGFLDVTGAWDPSLAFVMGGALAVFMPSYFFLIRPKNNAITGEALCIPSKQNIDTSLIFGASIFGLGWGIAGVCPGPAVSSLSFGNIGIVLFIVSMLATSLITKAVLQNKKPTSLDITS
ncbi:YeeE/YedE family protein [Vibrio sinensis]|uniref:YeeE/YedE family protein n=1 Tax=Vibrio sinensis TaxID=2302434 RepID=A0A3A6QRR5_9VIBR|nr:YeeE/YedE family protein [Vibrio sinensis]RJX75445.1 YeeE/YedE family protein [Vibrio sinensis]